MIKQVPMFPKFLTLGIAIIISVCSEAQNIISRIETAYVQFAADSQLRHAGISLYVIDAKTGEVIIDKNSKLGLAPASTQKIITSATAFELLGKDYRFKTELLHDGEIEKGTLKGNLYLVGSGDPSFGSWRWNSTKEDKVILEFVNALKTKPVKKIQGRSFFVVNRFESGIPDGWIWQDIGNYYGAAPGSLNWRENQYDMILKSGAIRGTAVEIVRTRPALFGYTFNSEVISNAKGTGDNAYIYLPIGSSIGIVKGTIPVEENEFTISGAMPSPALQFTRTLMDSFSKAGISQQLSFIDYKEKNQPANNMIPGLKNIYTYESPALDSIIYWFNKRSINLYGEALLRTIAFEKTGKGMADSGVAVTRKYWKERGIGEDELNMYDGSGLSPLNRVTTHAQVTILNYARSRSWFPYFFEALPEFNNMKMKSGTISDVKGFCGYQRSAAGKDYVFSFLVNNYSGRSSELVKKMYVVLDILK